jgi:hypothetical protein
MCCLQQMCSEGYNTVCMANALRRLQYCVYSRCVQKDAIKYCICVQKSAICCVQKMCSEVCSLLWSADVFRSLQSAMFSRCVQKHAVHYVQQMCSEVCNPPCSAGVFRSLQSAMFNRRKPYPSYWSLTAMMVLLIRGSFFVANLVHCRAPRSCTVTLVWSCMGPTVCACLPFSGTWLSHYGVNCCSRVLTMFVNCYHLHAY